MDIISGEQLICCMCEVIIDDDDVFFFPQVCQSVNGIMAHKICGHCWWNYFAVEGGNHPCPGCFKRIPLYTDKHIYFIE